MSYQQNPFYHLLWIKVWCDSVTREFAFTCSLLAPRHLCQHIWEVCRPARPCAWNAGAEKKLRPFRSISPFKQSAQGYLLSFLLFSTETFNTEGEVKALLNYSPPRDFWAVCGTWSKAKEINTLWMKSGTLETPTKIKTVEKCRGEREKEGF